MRPRISGMVEGREEERGCILLKDVDLHAEIGIAECKALLWDAMPTGPNVAWIVQPLGAIVSGEAPRFLGEPSHCRQYDVAGAPGGQMIIDNGNITAGNANACEYPSVLKCLAKYWAGCMNFWGVFLRKKYRDYTNC